MKAEERTISNILTEQIARNPRTRDHNPGRRDCAATLDDVWGLHKKDSVYFIVSHDPHERARDRRTTSGWAAWLTTLIQSSPDARPAPDDAVTADLGPAYTAATSIPAQPKLPAAAPQATRTFPEYVLERSPCRQRTGRPGGPARHQGRMAQWWNLARQNQQELKLFVGVFAIRTSKQCI